MLDGSQQKDTAKMFKLWAKTALENALVLKYFYYD